MNGVKLGFSFVDYAKRVGMGIGSVRLKDGSSIKFLAKPDGKAIDFFRIKSGRLLEASGYRGSDAVYHAANDVGYIQEKLALNPEDVEVAWNKCFDLIV